MDRYESVKSEPLPRVFPPSVIKMLTECYNACWPKKLKAEQSRHLNHYDENGQPQPITSVSLVPTSCLG